MSRFKNDLGEDRVTPTLDFGLVADGATFVVPDAEWAHWVAGGFTPLDPDPTPPTAPAKPTKTAAPAAPEGSGSA